VSSHLSIRETVFPHAPCPLTPKAYDAKLDPQSAILIDEYAERHRETLELLSRPEWVEAIDQGSSGVTIACGWEIGEFFLLPIKKIKCFMFLQYCRGEMRSENQWFNGSDPRGKR
jgi:hypothetical protein